LNWACILGPGTREQALQTARLPFVRPHVALMPDAHLGMGSTIGSVIPTVGAVMPASVGVDIGCGMAAVRTQLTRDDVAGIGRLSALREAIEEAVPASAGGYNRTLTATAAARVTQLEKLAEEALFDPGTYAANWRLQLGTLGSGNHFIEVCLDEADRLWVFLYSGSAAWATRSHSGTCARRSGCASAAASSCRTATSPTCPRTPTSSGTTSASCAGPSGSRWRTAPRCSTGSSPASPSGRAGTSSASRTCSATTTTPSGSGTSARRSGSPARARSTRRRVGAGSSPAPWVPGPTW